MLKKLPLDTQTFSEIVTKNLLYVDKTNYIFNLLDSGGKYFFLSRPRRFGKSLLVSMLKEIFEGNKDLFKGLYIYDKIEWKKHPIIHVDFTNIDFSDEVELQRSLLKFLHSINDAHDLKVSKTGFKSYFGELIETLSKKYNSKVAVLIDEYDKPILEHLTNVVKAKAVRQTLRKFFGVLKPSDPYLQFVLLTGVSKFSHVSIFSDLNNLIDITLNAEFATLLGITQNELEQYFDEYIDILTKKENTTRKDLLSKIQHWYNGYSWDGVTRVYNPLSLLRLFWANDFSNYWFSTGTPTFLVDVIKEKKYAIPNIENYKAQDSVFASFEIENLHVIALLFQSGYVTIKRIEKIEDGKLYILDYPNHEVKESLLKYLVSSYTTLDLDAVKPLTLELKSSLVGNDIEHFIQLMQSIIAGIPYTLVQENEGYYHSIFYLIATLMGAKVEPEVLTNQGRIDAVLELDDKIYIIEFKYGKDNVKNYALKAIKQIKEKKYHERYLKSKKKIYLLGVGFIKKKIQYKLVEH